MSNKSKIKALKIQYLNQMGITDLPLENIRIFCLGKELKDDLFLYSYDVANDMVMQAMIKQKWIRGHRKKKYTTNNEIEGTRVADQFVDISF